MRIALIVCALVATTFAMPSTEDMFLVDDITAARIDAQSQTLDRITGHFQSLMDRTEATLKHNQAAGDAAKHIINVHLEDKTCRSDQIRCGKSPQCVSKLFVCDDVMDCENHYDEFPVRCINPLVENSTWIGIPSYDFCTTRKPYELVLHITDVVKTSFFHEVQKLRIQMDLHSQFNGVEVSGTLLGDAEYSKGNQVLIVHPPEADGLAVEGTFDGVSNDRFIGYITRESSGERCAEFRFNRVK